MAWTERLHRTNIVVEKLMFGRWRCVNEVTYVMISNPHGMNGNRCNDREFLETDRECQVTFKTKEEAETLKQLRLKHGKLDIMSI